jgi:Glycosyltransferase family 17
MKIINNFLFRNEYDLLEIRLATEYEYVDQITIVESDHTFTGNYKGHNLEQHKERYAQWWDKIKYVKIGKAPHKNPMDAEHWNRNHFYDTWENMTEQDVVIINDVDEIIRAETLQFIRETDYNFYRLGMPFFNFKFNYLNIKGHTPWPSAKAFRGNFVKESDGMRGIQERPFQKNITLNHAGWHFSYLGDREWILEKMRSYAHPEELTDNVENNLYIDQLISQGKDFASRPGFVFAPVKLDSYFPKIILDNLSKYSNYILPDVEKSVLDYFPGTIP